MRTLTKITPCPIIDAVAEVRFERNPDIHPSILPGLFSAYFSAKFPKYEALPIMQIPEQARQLDPSLKHSPWIKMTNDKFGILVGAEMISVFCVNGYHGWTEYFNTIKDTITELNDKKIVNHAIRVGLRYADKFDIPVLPGINAEIKLFGCAVNNKETVVRSIISLENEMQVGVEILNFVDLIIENKKQSGVSVVSLDVFRNFDKLHLADVIKIFDDAHAIHKEKFIELVKEDFLKDNNFKLEWGEDG